MKKSKKQWKEYYASAEFKKKYEYAGNDLGAVWTEEKTVFKLWSPAAKEVSLHLYQDGYDVPSYEVHPMAESDPGVWFCQVPGDLHGVYYDFSIQIEEETYLTYDPYARACGVNGKRSMVIDLKKTDPVGWENDTAPSAGNEEFIYELHVKEFSWDKAGGFPEECRGRYSAFQCPATTLHNDGEHATGIGWLKRLGVTHVQLMPVYDFGSVDEREPGDQFNWGYDPVNYNIPEGSYSSDPYHGEIRIKEFKELVQSLHREGFRVIMDVVYNHTFSLENCFQKTAPWYYYRVHDDGTVSNGSACGNDVASERPMCSKYILESVLYWVDEYHIDGFRFDLMGLLDVDLMNEIRHELDVRYGKGEKLIYGEPWTAAETAMEDKRVQALSKNIGLLDENIGMFSDHIRDSVRGCVFIKNKPGFVNGGKELEDAVLSSIRAWGSKKKKIVKAPSQIISYLSCHDNQTLWDKLQETTRDEKLRRRQYRLAVGIYMTCLGRIFFLSGEEFLRTKNGLDNSYNADISINRLDWARAWEEQEMADYYRGLILLRDRLPGLFDKTCNAPDRIKTYIKGRGVVGVTVDNVGEGYPCRWETLCVVYNSTHHAQEIKLPAGEWEMLASESDSFLWQDPVRTEDTAVVEPVGMLLLGKKQ